MKIYTVKKNYNIFNKFCGYQVTIQNSNIEYSVPLDITNTHYQAIQKWIAEGGEVIDNPPTE